MGCSGSKSSRKNEERSSTLATSYRATEKGLSVYYLSTEFLKEAKDAGFTEKSSIYDLEDLSSPKNGLIRRKGQSVEDPMDGKTGCSYVDCLSGEDNVGPANVMISYSWAYCIGDIIDTLVDFCKIKNKEPKRTYVWICCLCVNQHRVVESSKFSKTSKGPNDLENFEHFQKVFHSRVTGVDEIISMMFPWDKPVYLSRIWCIFELFTAKNENCNLFIAMPPKERIKMAESLATQDGYEILLKALGGTSIQNASASREEDKVNILKLVENGPGFQKLNNDINDLLRDWIKEGILLAVDAVEAQTDNPSENIDFGLLVGQLGVVLDRTDSYDLSLELHKKTLDIFLTVYGEKNHEVASAHHNVGRALFKNGDYDGALSQYRKVLKIDEEIAGEEHPDTATSIANVADILKAQNKIEEAEEETKRALNIRLKALGSHPDTARSHSQLGLLFHQKEMYDEAIIEHKKALAMCLEHLGEHHPETATIYHNTGGALVEKADYGNAMLNFEKALVTYDYLLGSDHSKTQHTVAWIETCKNAMDEQITSE